MQTHRLFFAFAHLESEICFSLHQKVTDRLPPLTALRVFEAVARNNSLKRAAEELFVTPAAISHQVKLLEEHLGVELIKRKNRAIELTDAARAALPKLTEGFAALAQGAQRLRETTTNNALIISTPPSFAACWLMPRLHRFMSEHPEVEVRVSARSRNTPSTSVSASSSTAVSGAMASEESARWLADSDVAIFLSDGPLAHLHSELLVTLSLVTLASPRYLTQRGHQGTDKSWTAAQLQKHTLIHDDMGLLFDGYDFWDRLLAGTPLSSVPHQQGPRFSHTVLALEAASDDLGIVATVKQLAERELRDGRLLKAFAGETALPYGYYLVYRPERLSHAPVKHFRDWLMQQSASTLSGLPGE
jgi:LysR family transcriptional regulator, glycine cleavage system transcriptional activator